MDTSQLAACQLEQQIKKQYAAGQRSFERVDLREGSLTNLHLSDACFCWADMTSTDLEKTKLDRANLTGAMMWRANLNGASLLWANLHQAVMVRCRAVGANFSGASLHRADLRLADLRSLCLAGADLRGAKLCYSDLRGANLTGADLTGADLTGAKLIGACLEAVCWQAAVLPHNHVAVQAKTANETAEQVQHLELTLQQRELASATATENTARQRPLSTV